MPTNNDVKIYAKKHCVFLWEIAEAIGLADSNFSRKLRRELPANEKQRILAIIDEIAAAKKKMNAAV